MFLSSDIQSGKVCDVSMEAPGGARRAVASS